MKTTSHINSPKAHSSSRTKTSPIGTMISAATRSGRDAVEPETQDFCEDLQYCGTVELSLYHCQRVTHKTVH